MPETIYEHLQQRGLSRRDFLKLSGLLILAMGFRPASDLTGAISPSDEDLITLVTDAMQSRPRLPVIWLEFQDCAGCSESIIRSSAPSLTHLILNDMALAYHELLSCAAGLQAEQNREDAVKRYYGQYVLVVEGSIPTGENGVYCISGGRTALDIFTNIAAGAKVILAMGNCASFGGIARAAPDPTGAKSVSDLINGKTIVNIPGCPPIPEVIAGTIAHLALFDSPPALDALLRPITYYGQTVHDRCPRRNNFKARNFAKSFDDEGARKGYCLHELGCKGQTTYNACASLKWDMGLSFPIQSGHPCLGCAQPNFWDAFGIYQEAPKQFSGGQSGGGTGNQNPGGNGNGNGNGRNP